MEKILVTDGMDEEAVRSLRDLGYEVTEQFLKPEELKEEIKKFNVIVLRSATKIRKEIIDAAQQTGNLKLIIRAGVGLENREVAYAESKGIKVRNTPKASSGAVAELVLGHMFSLARFIGMAKVTMGEGKWEKSKYEGIELWGKTVRIIGLGRIGQELAKRALKKNIKEVVFDRGGYRYHGRVKALADGARKGGLQL